MTAPNAHIRVSGAWKQVNKMHVKVSGAWKRVNNAYVRAGGAWKKFLQSVASSSWSGFFSATGAAATVSSAARTYTLGAGNSGQVQFTSVNNTGSGSVRYSKNGGGNVGISEGDVITMANTNTLSLSANGLTSGTSGSCNVIDVDTGATWEFVVLSRS